MELEKSKAGVLTMQYNNKYIHSKYDPIRESEQFVANNVHLIKNNIIVIYGLGLGYHINCILNYITDGTKVYIFEWNKDLISACKMVNPDLFTNKYIEIFDSTKKEFFEKLSFYLSKVTDIIVHKPSLETISETNDKLYMLIKGYLITKQWIRDNGSLLEENYIYNSKINAKSIKELINNFAKVNRCKPYVIVASGPSLDFDLDLLKENRERFNIISVGSALRSLMNKGIKPDAIVIMDGKEIVKNQLRDYENSGISLCFLSTASRWAVETYNGPRYIFYNSDGEDEIIIRTGKTVAVAAIDIALKSGAQEIILLGQDLAFLDNKSHTETFEATYGFKDVIRKSGVNKFVKSIDGKMLETTEGYLYFKAQIELIINESKSISFINCSKGALIEGAVHMSLSQYLNNYIKE